MSDYNTGDINRRIAELQRQLQRQTQLVANEQQTKNQTREKAKKLFDKIKEKYDKAAVTYEKARRDFYKNYKRAQRALDNQMKRHEANVTKYEAMRARLEHDLAIQQETLHKISTGKPQSGRIDNRRTNYKL